MKSDNSLPVRIRAADLPKVERWRLPDMTDAERERLVALARRPDPTPLHAVEVVDEEIYAEKLTLTQWESLCEQARQEGLQQGHDEGHAQGLAQGREEGLAQGVAQGRERIEQQFARLEAIIDSLQQPLQQQRSALESVLVALASRLARVVVGAELQTRPELLQATIAAALDAVPPGSGVPLLRLNPRDCEMLTELAARQGWELVPDDTMEAGGVCVQAGSCRVDADLDSRFGQVAEQLRERLNDVGLSAGGDEAPAGNDGTP